MSGAPCAKRRNFASKKNMLYNIRPLHAAKSKCLLAQNVAFHSQLEILLHFLKPCTIHCSGPNGVLASANTTKNQE